MRNSRLHLLYSQEARGLKRYSSLRRYSENDELAEKLDLSDFESAVESLQAIAEEARAQSRRKRYYSDEEDVEEDAIDPEHEKEVLRIAAPFLKALNISPGDLEDIVEQTALQSSRHHRWSRYAEQQSSEQKLPLLPRYSGILARPHVVKRVNELVTSANTTFAKTLNVLSSVRSNLSKYGVDAGIITEIQNNMNTLGGLLKKLVEATQNEPEKLLKRTTSNFFAILSSTILTGSAGCAIGYAATNLALGREGSDFEIINQVAYYLQDMASQFMAGTADIKQTIFAGGVALASGLIGFLVARVFTALLNKPAIEGTMKRIDKTSGSVDRLDVAVANLTIKSGNIEDVNVKTRVVAFYNELHQFLSKKVPELMATYQSGDLNQLLNDMDIVTAELGNLIARHKEALSELGVELGSIGAEAKKDIRALRVAAK